MNKDPLKELYHEHEVISSALESVDRAGDVLRESPEKFEDLVRKLLSFFRKYADSYHHHKEEIILFPEMCRKNELLAEGVIKEMMENHEDFREMLRRVEQFLDKADHLHAQQQLLLYAEALRDHIAVENDELFVTAETLFTSKELEQLYFRFEDCDMSLGEEEKRDWEKSIAGVS